MPKLRHQLRRKVEQADNLLENSQSYLEEVGFAFSERLPELSEKFAIVHSALEKIQEALRKLLEEM